MQGKNRPQPGPIYEWSLTIKGGVRRLRKLADISSDDDSEQDTQHTNHPLHPISSSTQSSLRNFFPASPTAPNNTTEAEHYELEEEKQIAYTEILEEEKKNAPDYEQRTLDDFMNIEPLQQPAENTKEGQPVTVLQWNCCHLTSDKIQYIATKALN